MEKLIEVMKIVADKYSKDVNLILADNYLTLEYFTIRGDTRDLYKTVRIDEFEDKLKIKIYEDGFEKLIDPDEIEDIIKILEKQSKKLEHTPEEVKYIKDKYKLGTEVKLIKMYDFQSPPLCTRGRITNIDDKGTIHVDWETGSKLGLVVGTDEFEIVDEESEQEHIQKLQDASRFRFVADFNKEFGTQLQLEQKDISLLMRIYHDYIEESFKPGSLHNHILDKILEIEDALCDSLLKEQKVLFDKWETYRDELDNYNREQSFLYRIYVR